LSRGGREETTSSGGGSPGHPAPALFYWQDEQVDGATSVMHFQMTKRAYEQVLALAAGSKLRIRPAETGNQTR